jgi:hypothetical protein
VGLNGSNDEFEIGNIAEYGLDVSYNINALYDLTVGLGWLRETGFSALEEVQFGSGLSFRWYRPKLFFSSPTFGVHFTPESSATEILFSTSIY